MSALGKLKHAFLARFATPMRAVWATMVVLLILYTLVKLVAQILDHNERLAVEEDKVRGVHEACRRLEAAINRFCDQNDVLPLNLITDQTFDLDSPQGLEMLRVLGNVERESFKKNQKGFNYLESVWIAPYVYDKGYRDVEAKTDPWGGSYQVRIDGDRDLSIEVKPKAASKTIKVKGRTAVVWSNGKDPDDPKDDVTTW